jgi:hypothetical protein
MNAAKIWLMALGCCGVAWAAEPPPAAPAATPAEAKAPATSEQPPASPSAAAKTDAAEDEEKLPPAPSSADKKASPQRFVPSEQVRADFDVSFPIDI